jgi:hypothetical protein
LRLSSILIIVLTVVAAIYPALPPGQPGRTLIDTLYVVCVICLGSLCMVFDLIDSHAGTLRNLQSRSWQLAIDLRHFLDTNPVYTYSLGGIVTNQERALHDENTARQYVARFKTRVDQVTRELRRRSPNSSDVLFRHVDEGPQNDHDVFQIIAGLERMAKELPVKRLA